MANTYSAEELVDFLEHAGERGLVPVATAQALAVATRNVLDILSDQEKKELNKLDVDAVIKRFTNKRATEFSASTVKEYGRRVRRAIELFRSWQADPASFSTRTRATAAARARERHGVVSDAAMDDTIETRGDVPKQQGTYQSAIPIRPGTIITLSNIPHDLTKAEAERLANFVRLLAV